MPMCDIFDVGEVEQVVVVAQLEARAGSVVDIDDRGQQLSVTGAEDCGRTDGDGEEFRRYWIPVRSYDELLCICLWLLLK